MKIKSFRFDPSKHLYSLVLFGLCFRSKIAVYPQKTTISNFLFGGGYWKCQNSFSPHCNYTCSMQSNFYICLCFICAIERKLYLSDGAGDYKMCMIYNLIDCQTNNKSIDFKIIMMIKCNSSNIQSIYISSASWLLFFLRSPLIRPFSL